MLQEDTNDRHPVFRDPEADAAEQKWYTVTYRFCSEPTKVQHILCGGVPSQIHMEFKGPQTTRAALERQSGAAGPTHFPISKLTTKPQQPEKCGTGLEIDT